MFLQLSFLYNNDIVITKHTYPDENVRATAGRLYGKNATTFSQRIYCIIVYYV